MSHFEIEKMAADTFGFISQARQTQEECAELIVAISHRLRGRATLGSLASEVADVEIMIDQMRYFIGNDLVDRAKNEKLIRLRAMTDEAING